MKHYVNILKDTTQGAFKKGFFNLLSANLLINIVAFASQLFVAKILAPEDMGRIKVLQTFFSIFAVIGSLGMTTSTLKLCSEDRSEDEVKKIFGTGLIFTLISTIILYFILLIINYFNVFFHDNTLKIIFPLALFPLVTNSLFFIFINYFQGIKKIKLISNLTFANKALSIAAIILFTYFLGIKGYYWAYNLSLFFMLLVCFRLVKPRSIFNNLRKERIFHKYLPLHWYYAKSSIWALLLSDIIDFSDILLLNFFVKDMQQVGFYGFALTLMIVLRLIPSTVQQISSPYLSAKSNRITEFTSAYKKYFKFSLFIISITLILSIILGPFFIDIIFHGKYNASIPFFIPLSIGWSIRQINQLQSAALFGLGKINYIAYSNLISVIFTILILFIAFTSFGIIGVAYSSILSGIISVLSEYLFLRNAIKQREFTY